MARKRVGKKSTGTKRRTKSAQKPKKAALQAPVTTSQVPPPPGSTLPAVIPPMELSPPVRAELALQQRQIERTRKQRWKNVPKSSRMRTTVMKAVALKIQGNSTQEIADMLGIKPATIRQYMWIAGQNGWLTTADPQDHAEHVLVHRAVSNLEELLHARNAATGLPDKEVTLETVKGLGIFKNGQQAEREGGNTNILAINIQVPQGVVLTQPKIGNTGGTPAFVEGQVLGRQSVK